MCDYSVNAEKQRAAKAGDVLVTCRFPGGSVGFRSCNDSSQWAEREAVCLTPGTEIVFSSIPRTTAFNAEPLPSKTARFRQRNLGERFKHHDALEFDDGTVVALAALQENLTARVLQLPVGSEREFTVQREITAESHHHAPGAAMTA